ncbi:MAG TPA: hypothetical protein VJ438_05330, partial [Candidatus Nanoarchaeia archaeon]|nr:hypothetical protein [Candidatus Nanoarchaeia archaeon]
MELTSRPIEKIEKKGEPIVLGVKHCKSYRKALETLIGLNYKRGHTELEFYTRGLLELYNKFHPERVLDVEVDRWKGKSTFEIIKNIDKLIIIKYIKKDRDSLAQEVRVELIREELQALITVIKRLSQHKELIPTKEIARDYCLELN